MIRKIGETLTVRVEKRNVTMHPGDLTSVYLKVKKHLRENRKGNKQLKNIPIVKAQVSRVKGCTDRQAG